MNNKKNSGQALIAGMALLAIAGIMFFFIFNSGRAVNEKINLVNAADAAAYSGAQIAARQLNFMAYTNRVMIANEVAIGRPEYKADASTNTYVSLTAIWDATKHIQLLGQIKYENLGSGTTDSPIVDEDSIVTAVIGAVYLF